MFRRPERLFKVNSIAATLDWPQIIGRIPNAVREIPARLRVTDRCAANWLDGKTKPNGDNVVQLMAAFDEVADEILRLSQRREGGLTEVQKRKPREILGD